MSSVPRGVTVALLHDRMFSASAAPVVGIPYKLVELYCYTVWAWQRGKCRLSCSAAVDSC